MVLCVTPPTNLLSKLRVTFNYTLTTLQTRRFKSILNEVKIINLKKTHVKTTSVVL